MQASKEQIVLSAVFALGVIALGLDRMILSDSISSPAQAKASTPTTTAKTKAPTKRQSPNALSQRLRTVAANENLDLALTTNAFSLDNKDPALQPAQTTERAPTGEQDFRQAHRLVGVMADRGEKSLQDAAESRVAFIELLSPDNAKPHIVRLKQGDTIGGFTIAQLGLPGTDNQASPFVVLAHDGVTFRLSATNSP